MSECVVRMEMPSNCERCPMCGTASGGNGRYELWCMCGDIPASSWRRPKDCPILCQLPEGHGRLVDEHAIKLPKGFFEKVDNVPKFYEWLNSLPTIVPAEAERSET